MHNRIERLLGIIASQFTDAQPLQQESGLSDLIVFSFLAASALTYAAPRLACFLLPIFLGASLCSTVFYICHGLRA
jgi:hypothetical protein